MRRCTIFRHKLSNELILMNLVVIFIPLVLLTMSSVHIFSDNLLAERDASNQYVADTMAKSVQMTLGNINESSLSLIADINIRNYIMQDFLETSNNALHQYSEACAVIRQLIAKQPAILQICVMSPDGRMISIGSQKNVSITEQDRALMDKHSKGTWFWNLSGDSVSVCRLIRDVNDVQKRIGYLKLVVSSNYFLNLFRIPANSDSTFFSLNSSDGTILISNLPEKNHELLAFTSETPEILIHNIDTSVKYSANTGNHILHFREIDRGRAYLVIYAEDLSGYFILIRRLIVLGAALFYGILIFIQTRLHQRLLIRPIERIGKMMSNVDTNNFSHRLEVDSSSEEIRTLTEEFNRMMDQLQYLYNEVYQGQLLLKEAELKNLQKEINPHFLYNVIDSVCWMINLNRTQEAEWMLHLLSNLYRSILHQTSDSLIPLAKEIEHTENYMQLQRICLSGKVNFTEDIQEGLEDVYVTKFVLQPMLENAILHGFFDQNITGTISLAVYTEDEDIIYVIYDDGAGADPIEIESLLETGFDHHGEKKVALYNINQRIRIRFGKKYGITYHRPTSGGSVFRIRQPIVYGVSNQAEASGILGVKKGGISQ